MDNVEIKQLCSDFIHRMNFSFIKVKPNVDDMSQCDLQSYTPANKDL